MQTLIALVKPFLAIIAHRAGPEDLPKSQLLLVLVIIANIVVYYVGMIAFDAEPRRALALPFLDSLAEIIFFSAVLLGMGMHSRLVQTLIAAFGTGTILSIVSIFLAMFRTPDSQQGIFVDLALMALILLSLGVKGHILRRAVGFPYFVGVLISAGFFVAFILFDNALFGVPS